MLSDHPDLDCLINNAGVQRPLQVLGPDSDFDLSSADEEININIRGPMYLCVKLIQQHFSTLDSAVVINVSSVLGFIPFSVVNPNYNATKAWLHSFTTTLRTQLSQAQSPIKVVELAPPAVQTDLHRDRKHAPPPRSSQSLTLEQFMVDAKEGLEQDWDIISAGPGKERTTWWYDSVGAAYEKMSGEEIKRWRPSK